MGFDQTSIPIENMISIVATGPSGDMLYFVENAISFRVDEDITVMSDRITFENPKTTSDISITGETTRFIANSVTTLGSTNQRYGINIESDSTITFDSFDNIRVESQKGNVLFTASEDFTLSINNDINYFSGNDLLVSTGFTPQPNQQIPFRAGIIFNGVTKSSFRSEHHDIIMEAEDASWSASSNLVIRSGGSTTIDSGVTNLLWESPRTLDLSSENIDVFVEDEFDIVVQNNGNARFTARNSLIIESFDEITVESDNDNILIEAERAIVFTTPAGYVEMGEDFFTPVLKSDGGVSGDGNPYGDKYRFQEENQYPNCEERSFGFDVDTNSFCYCQFNKWRCMEAR